MLAQNHPFDWSVKSENLNNSKNTYLIDMKFSPRVKNNKKQLFANFCENPMFPANFTDQKVEIPFWSVNCTILR